MTIDYSVYLFFAVFILLLALLLRARQGKRIVAPIAPIPATFLTTGTFARLPIDDQILVAGSAQTMTKEELAREYLENLRLTGTWTGQRKKSIRKPSAVKGLRRDERWINDDESEGPDPMPTVMKEYYSPLPTHGAAKHLGKKYWSYQLRVQMAVESSRRFHSPDPGMLPEELRAIDVYANYKLTDTQRIVRQRRQQVSLATRNKKRKFEAAIARGRKAK